MDCGYLRFNNIDTAGTRTVAAVGTRDRATGMPHCHDGTGFHPGKPSYFGRIRHGEPGDPADNAVLELSTVNFLRGSRRYCVLVEELSMCSECLSFMALFPIV